MCTRGDVPGFYMATLDIFFFIGHWKQTKRKKKWQPYIRCCQRSTYNCSRSYSHVRITHKIYTKNCIQMGHFLKTFNEVSRIDHMAITWQANQSSHFSSLSYLAYLEVMHFIALQCRGLSLHSWDKVLLPTAALIRTEDASSAWGHHVSSPPLENPPYLIFYDWSM